MTNSRTVTIESISEQIQIGDGNLKVFGNFRLELTQNQDGTAKYQINGYATDFEQVNAVVAYLNNLSIQPLSEPT